MLGLSRENHDNKLLIRKSRRKGAGVLPTVTVAKAYNIWQPHFLEGADDLKKKIG